MSSSAGERDRRGLGALSGIAIGWHGMPEYARRAIAALVRRCPGVRFTLLTTRSDDYHRYEAAREIAGVPVRVVDDARPQGWSALGEPLPDVFAFTSWDHPSYMRLATELRAAGGATVCMMDNIANGRPRQWLGAVWFRLRFRRLFSHLLVPGARARAFGRLLGMPDDRIVEGLYGADEKVFAPDGLNARESQRTGVLFVGQFITRKGVGALLHACRDDAQLRGELIMIGTGPLSGVIDAAGVARMDFAPAATLARRYREASLFILPSVCDHWGVVLHEAALAGCLLAATRGCGASDDLIRHGVNGFVMRDSSAAEVSRALAWWRSLEHDSRRAGREVSRARAARFGPEAFCRAFERIAGTHRVVRSPERAAGVLRS
jgi:glycosyltransferase involved in cell wall biosynthesis